MQSDDDYVEGADFVEAVRPCVEAISRLAAAALAVPGIYGHLPVADSRAMAELAEEERYTKWGWAEPVHEVLSTVGLLSFAGLDHIRSFGRLFESTPVPVYSHLVTARAGLEAFGWCYWLSDPAIGVEQRVKRERAYQLDDARQRKRLGLDESNAASKTIIERIRTGAPPGWHPIVCNDKNIVVGTEHLPRTTKVIEAVLGPTADARDTLGKTLWSVLSGAAHSTRYALSMALGQPLEPTSVGPLIAPFSTSSSTVHLVGCVVIRAAINSCAARYALLGWDENQEWRDAVNVCDDYIRAVMRTVR